MLAARRIIVLCAMCFAPGGAYAQQTTLPPEQVSEVDYLQHMPIVLSGSRLSQPLSDSPVAITLIDREMIQASGIRSLAEIFRLVPGFLVGYDDGNNPVVSYHMLNEQYSRRMQVLVDGRSVYTPTFGGVPWFDLPLTIDEIERIEVIRGPNAASYGANSFLGVISITTRNASLTQGSHLRLDIGENNIRDGFYRYGGTSNGINYRLSLGYQQDDGFATRHDSKRIHLIDARADYQVNLQDRFMVKTGLTRNTYQADTIFGPTDYPPHNKETYTSYQQIKWVRTTSPDNALSLQFYHNFHKVTDDVTSLPYASLGGVRLPLSYSYQSERYEIELQKSLAVNTRTRLVWGGSVRQDLVTSHAYFGQNSPLSVWTRRLFSHTEWRPQARFVINAGVMLEDNSITGSDLSPLLAVNYHINTRHTLRFSYSRATRTPVLLEERAYEYNTFGSLTDVSLYSPGNLRAETISAYELGYIGLYPRRGLQIDAKVYYNELRKLIAYEDKPYPDNVNGKASQFANYDNVRLSGFEAGIQYRPTHKTRYIIAYNYSDINATDKTHQTQYTHSAPLTNFSLLAIHRYAHGYTASIGYYYTGTMQGWDTLKFRQPMRKLDAQIRKDFRLGDTQASISLIAQNMLDDYQEMKLKNIARRTLYLRLTLSH